MPHFNKHKARHGARLPRSPGVKKILNTETKTETKTSTEPDGTVVEVTKTIIIEKYDDGSSATRTETRTVRKPVNAPTDANGKAIQYLNPDLTPENSQAPKVSNTTDPAFIKGCLEAQNSLRSKHGSPPLTLNSELAKIAQAWANELARKGTMQHNTTGFGENVYWNTDPPPANRPADAWYSEIKDYNFKKLEGQSGCGHFTQLIWKGSKEVGIALAKGPKGYFIVANYNPPGNIKGQYPANIQPKG